jgi:16S rRNA (cytosine1402-N4)-methyltransferase
MTRLHIPVMLKEILSMVEPLKERSNLRYYDGTFGRGGHLQALLEAHPKINAVAMDRDLESIEFGQKEFATWISEDRLRLIHSNYSDFEKFDLGLFDFMLLDLGVSSPQLDQGRRGFSFYHDGPLDMRMNQADGLTAAEIINNYTEDELVQLFMDLGEVSRPNRVVRAIVHDRKEKMFATTRDLAGLIERVDGWHRKGHHPATQYFLALRMEVNQELSGVEQVLKPLVLGLKPKGRLAVLTFHSLEDRIVKNVFKSLEDLGRPVTKKVLQPEWAEAKTNSRARSAKLRVFERSETNEADVPTLATS